MKQITEDYVSYEIAVLLKEKGFDGECQGYYEIPTEISSYKDIRKQLNVLPKNWNEYGKECVVCEYVSIPTHQMALKWLREVYNIFIEIKYLPNQFTDEPSYKAVIWDMSEEIGKPLPDDIEYMFYETCVNDALKYTLENLV